MKNKNTIKIALATYWFYPNTAMATRRLYNICRHLNQHPNIQLDVFTPAFNFYSFAGDRRPEKFCRINYLKLYKNKFEKRIFSQNNSFYHLINKTFYRGLAQKRLARAFIKKVEDENYDIFYFSLGPFSTLLKSALILKRKFPKKQLVIEYRDEWIEGSADYAARHHLIHPRRRWKSRYRKIANYFEQIRGKQLEEKTLLLADRVIVVSEEMIDNFCRRVAKLSPEKFSFIPNGISDLEINQLKKHRLGSRTRPGKNLKIMYGGNLFGVQDIKPLLYPIANLLDREVIQPGEIEINIFGRHQKINREWPSFLRTLIHCRGEVSQDELFRQYYAHDILILIIGDWPKSDTIMTGKIFELIESRQPVLALLPLEKTGVRPKTAGENGGRLFRRYQ